MSQSNTSRCGSSIQPSTGPRKIAITGVSRGLGQALSQAFSARGIHVYGCARHPVLGADSTTKLARSPGHFQIEACVTSQPAMDYFARLVCAGGSPDVVIANAGVIHVRRPIWELPAETWQAVLSVNVSGVAHTARAFLPEMIRSGKRGLFIAISSGWGAKPAEGLGPYCASKFAVEGIVAVLNRELPNGIRAIALDPAAASTRICWPLVCPRSMVTTFRRPSGPRPQLPMYCLIFFTVMLPGLAWCPTQAKGKWGNSHASREESSDYRRWPRFRASRVDSHKPLWRARRPMCAKHFFG